MIKNIKKGSLRLRNRYYLANQGCQNRNSANGRISSSKGKSLKKSYRGPEKSVFAKNENDKIEPKDLKLDLSEAKQHANFSTKEKNRGPNYYEDPRFNKIMEDKKKLNKLKIRNKQKELMKSQIKEKEKLKVMQKIELETKEFKKEKAKSKIEEVLKRKKEREDILKSSLSYKFLKNSIPLYKQIELKLMESSLIKSKPAQKNHRVPLEEILNHSKLIKTKQIEKQRERWK